MHSSHNETYILNSDFHKIGCSYIKDLEMSLKSTLRCIINSWPKDVSFSYKIGKSCNDCRNQYNLDCNNLYQGLCGHTEFITEKLQVGPRGIQGPIGPVGEQGPFGPKGVAGKNGLKGEKGDGSLSFRTDPIFWILYLILLAGIIINGIFFYSKMGRAEHNSNRSILL